jgi:hypothetical protein
MSIVKDYFPPYEYSISASNEITESIIQQMIDENYLEKHFYDTLEEFENDGGCMGDFFSRLCVIKEPDVILYYLNKCKLTTEQQQLMSGYFREMSSLPETDMSLSILKEEAAARIANHFMIFLNGFTKENLLDSIICYLKEEGTEYEEIE